MTVANDNNDDSLFGLLGRALKGSLGPWVRLMFVYITVITGFWVWSIVRFYGAEALKDLIFWGVWLIIFTLWIVALKIWLWLEMNRQSLLRRIDELKNR